MLTNARTAVANRLLLMVGLLRRDERNETSDQPEVRLQASTKAALFTHTVTSVCSSKESENKMVFQNKAAMSTIAALFLNTVSSVCSSKEWMTKVLKRSGTMSV